MKPMIENKKESYLIVHIILIITSKIINISHCPRLIACMSYNRSKSGTSRPQVLATNLSFVKMYPFKEKFFKLSQSKEMENINCCLTLFYFKKNNSRFRMRRDKIFECC